MAELQQSRAISRRRFIRISAAAAGLTALPLRGPMAGEAASIAWRGVTLGALTSIQVRHPDRVRAEAALRAAAGEVARLERVFTLYDKASALVRLNAAGRLDAPPTDLVRLLSEACSLGDLTGGAFDVSVQPLWQTHLAHFTAAPDGSAGPAADELKRAAALVDYRAIDVAAAAIRLGRPGMALTLNGIAPGYLTDRIVELLKNEGFDSVLVDLGEIRAAGTRDGRQPWRAELREVPAPDGGPEVLPLTDAALATSKPAGFQFDHGGRFHHIFDPRSGTCPQRYASVSVVASTATVADALATALLLVPLQDMAPMLRGAGAKRAFVTGRDGTLTTLDA